MADSRYSKEIRKAIRSYWRAKRAAQKKNQSGQRVDSGNRGGATAGKNLDGLAEVFAQSAKRHGPKSLDVYRNKTQVVLPGHFRPTSLDRLLKKFVAHIQIETSGNIA